MGRGKLRLNLMPNRKSRSSTFKKRKNSLIKKAYELSTLCDVRTCVLIHGPASTSEEDRSQSDVEFHIWPPNRSEIEGMIHAYKNNNCLMQKRKCFDLYDFFSDRKRKIETEMFKIRENVEEILSQYDLREFMDGLNSKIDAASSMIDFMEAVDYDNLFGDQDDQIVLPPPPPLMPLPSVEFADFPESLISPNNNNGDQIEYNFEHLQLLLEEEDDNEFINLMNKKVIDYSNNHEYLFMCG